jgi:hypothetical protein
VLFVEAVSEVFRDFLERDDMTILESALSSGKSQGYFFGTDQANLESVRLLTTLFLKLPSEQAYIQTQIASFFKALKAQHVSTETSFLCYDRTLAANLDDPVLIENHLSFALDMLPPPRLAKVLKEWFVRIRSEALLPSFSFLSHFFLALAEQALA